MLRTQSLRFPNYKDGQPFCAVDVYDLLGMEINVAAESLTLSMACGEMVWRHPDEPAAIHLSSGRWTVTGVHAVSPRGYPVALDKVSTPQQMGNSQLRVYIARSKQIEGNESGVYCALEPMPGLVPLDDFALAELRPDGSYSFLLHPRSLDVTRSLKEAVRKLTDAAAQALMHVEQNAPTGWAGKELLIDVLQQLAWPISGQNTVQLLGIIHLLRLRLDRLRQKLATDRLSLKVDSHLQAALRAPEGRVVEHIAHHALIDMLNWASGVLVDGGVLDLELRHVRPGIQPISSKTSSVGKKRHKFEILARCTLVVQFKDRDAIPNTNYLISPAAGGDAPTGKDQSATKLRTSPDSDRIRLLNDSDSNCYAWLDMPESTEFIATLE